jgi:P-type Ca2+ transporter type 2C
MPLRPIHALRVAEVYTDLETSPEGLTSGEAELRLHLYGPNALPDPPSVPVWRKAFQHLFHPMALVLWGAGLLALVVGHPTLPWAIWFVVAINAAFSFWQEHQAEQAILALSHLLPSYTRLIREGQELLLPTNDLVPGDVLILEQGNNIPADARIVEQYGLRANQATLTGEASAAVKTEAASLREGLTDLERPNLVFAGSSVISGTGRAIVFATGTATQFGRIARLTQQIEEAPSRLQREITRLTRVISFIAVGISAVVFAVGTTDVGIPRDEAFILAIGILVAALPEGLRPTLTLSLAIAVQRLATKGVLVKRLASIETLGKVSVICTDKSGTLTHNQMTVREVWAGGHRMRVTGAGYEPEGGFTAVNGAAASKADLKAMLMVAAMCNNARLVPPTLDRPNWMCLGDQTEAALRVCALKAGVDEEKLDDDYPRIHEIPFEAARKRMTTIHRKNGVEVAFVKGAPREVLQSCTHVLIDGEEHPLDDETRAEILKVNDSYARRALRVLALARRELPAREGRYVAERIEQDLTFLGLAAMMDPPRPEVSAAMKTFHEAGIRVVMITGDYGLTAESVARRVGMLTTERPRIITGADLDALTDAELRHAIHEEVIFARVAPEHKLRVVAAFESRGDTVAVIGDGVNDGPALRKADIGIAMGKGGTDVAREAADVILTDDNFAAIVSAVEEGRAIFRNIRKFITYILASNVPEIMPFVMTAMFDLPLALTVAQILAIDLGTDLLPSLALGAEKPEPDVMKSPPRRRDQELVNGRLVSRAVWLGMIETVLCYAGFLAVFILSGNAELVHLESLDALAYPDWHLPVESAYLWAGTVFFAGVVTAQVGNAFACRRERPGVHELGWFSNHYLMVGVVVQVLLAVALLYFSPMAMLFDLVALPPLLWLGLIAYAPILYGVERLRKILALRLPTPAEPPMTENISGAGAK